LTLTQWHYVGILIASLMSFMLQQGLPQQIWRCHPSTSVMPFDLHRK
jgi:hypothetical protein